MPYEIRSVDKKFCVFNTQTDDNKGCSPTRELAVGHMKALYSAEAAQAELESFAEGDMAPGPEPIDPEDQLSADDISFLKAVQKFHNDLFPMAGAILNTTQNDDVQMLAQMHIAEISQCAPKLATWIKTGNTADDDEDQGYGGPSSMYQAAPVPVSDGAEEFSWSGPIVFEGQLTGDNRIFKAGSIQWDDTTLPWAFRWQKASTQGHAGAVPIGRVDKLERMDDGAIYGYGVIIPSLNEEAAEYLRLIEAGVASGVSVDGDSAEFDVQEETEGKPRVEFSSMRLRSLTAVDIPAFNAARVQLGDGPTVTSTEIAPPEKADEPGSVEASDQKTNDAPGSTVSDAPLPSKQDDLRVALAAKRKKNKMKTMGYAYNGDVITASAIPIQPPIAAFQDPVFDGPVPLTVSKTGEVFGHLALFDSCHIGFPGTCVSPPKGSSYKYFHTGEVETQEGDLVQVGHLTFNTGHAGMKDTAKNAAAHYDHTGSVAADVRAGEDKFGIWVVGALRPTLSDEDIRTFRAAPLSGDWRRIAGKLELVGALSVNVPGFPVPRVRALVAAGSTETLLTFTEEEDPELSDYETKLRLAKKTDLSNRIEGEQ